MARERWVIPNIAILEIGEDIIEQRRITGIMLNGLRNTAHRAAGGFSKTARVKAAQQLTTGAWLADAVTRAPWSWHHEEVSDTLRDT